MRPLLQREHVRVGSLDSPGLLTLPSDAPGLVLFALGSDKSGNARRPTQHDEFVANALHVHGVGTLLMDLSNAAATATTAERPSAVEIERQTECVMDALGWATRHAETAGLRLGVFGIGAGAAAALRAAADHANAVCAVVSRSGWPDLAGAAALLHLDAPTLLIVGGEDADALARNRHAMRQMSCRKRLEVVPGASRGFSEPGTLDAAAHLAGAWFATHLSARCGT